MFAFLPSSVSKVSCFPIRRNPREKVWTRRNPELLHATVPIKEGKRERLLDRGSGTRSRDVDQRAILGKTELCNTGLIIHAAHASFEDWNGISGHLELLQIEWSCL